MKLLPIFLLLFVATIAFPQSSKRLKESPRIDGKWKGAATMIINNQSTPARAYAYFNQAFLEVDGKITLSDLDGNTRAYYVQGKLDGYEITLERYRVEDGDCFRFLNDELSMKFRYTRGDKRLSGSTVIDTPDGKMEFAIVLGRDEE